MACKFCQSAEQNFDDKGEFKCVNCQSPIKYNPHLETKVTEGSLKK